MSVHRPLSLSDKALKVDDQAKIYLFAYVAMYFCQICHFSRYLAKLTKIRLTGVIFAADKENWVEKQKFFESRDLNPKFPNFKFGHRLLGLCLIDLEADEH